MEVSQATWQCHQLQKSFGPGGFQLANINLELNTGEITGVVGENGNGKTTLLRVIAGELAADKGTIQFNNSEIGSADWRTYKEQISYIPQRIPRWYGYLKTNLVFQASIHGFPSKEIDQRLEVLLEELGLTKYAHLKWTEISTGYRLRFQLAKMLINRPKLLVLDEPIANLDVKAQDKFLSDLQRIVQQNDFKTSVILSSQQLHQVEAFADNIVFIEDGNIKYSGAVKDVGADRKSNLFEITIDIEKSTLQQLLGTELLSIVQKGNVFSIETSTSLSANQFLQKMAQTGKTIGYFRDISSSTKKLFRQQ